MAKVTPHICPECGNDFVIPRDWWEEEEQETDGWVVDLWCGWCHWGEIKEIDEDSLDDYDERLDEGMQKIQEDLHRLTTVNMGEYINLFLNALKEDAIQPVDF